MQAASFFGEILVVSADLVLMESWMHGSLIDS
jgi:hypothetical protein